jgi:hypothetical protein
MIIHDWFQQTTSRGLEYQRMLIPKILKNPICQHVLNLLELKNAHNAINNFSKGWQHIRGCHSKDD